MMRIIDSHGHYDDEQFTLDRDELLKGLKQKGIETVVNVGSSIEASRRTIELTKKYPFVYGAIGVHPNETAELDDEKFQWLKEASCNDKIVAIGEIGLDYYWDEPASEVQKKWFRLQLNLAREVKLPVIIHSRDAAKDTLDIMKAEKAEEIGGVVHCFSYAKEMAAEYVKMGFYIGIGGVVTFKNAKALKAVAEAVPLERIVLETDCPYLAPEPYRGKRNDSSNLVYVAKAIADIRGISEDEVIKVTRNNTKKLYQI